MGIFLSLCLAAPFCQVPWCVTQGICRVSQGWTFFFRMHPCQGAWVIHVLSAYASWCMILSSTFLDLSETIGVCRMHLDSTSSSAVLFRIASGRFIPDVQANQGNLLVAREVHLMAVRHAALHTL